MGCNPPGYQLIIARLDEYTRLADELTAAHRDRVEGIIKTARDSLESRVLKLVPYPKYDYAWARLHEVRHLFCQLMPLDRMLGAVIEDMAGDLDYLVGDEQRAVREELQKLRERCLAAISAEGDEGRRKGHKDDTSEAALRAAAEGLSKHLSVAREGTG